MKARAYISDDTMKDELAGTTAVVVLIKNNKLYCVSIVDAKILREESKTSDKLGPVVQSIIRLASLLRLRGQLVKSLTTLLLKLLNELVENKRSTR